MSMLVQLGLTSTKVQEPDVVAITDAAPEGTWADIDQAADAKLLMDTLPGDADAADIPMFEAAYTRSLERPEASSAR